MVLITYDVNTTTPAGQKRLRQVAKHCENYGQRVQNSVFECLIDGAQLKMLRALLVNAIDPENDSLRFYYLSKNWNECVEHIGAKPSIDLEGPIIV